MKSNNILVILLFILIFGLFFIIGRRQLRRNSISSSKSLSATSHITPKKQTELSGNPFGVMLGSIAGITVAKTLGVEYYRPLSLSTSRWSGQCEECDAATKAGLNLALTVRNDQGPQQASVPPTDYDAYKKTIKNIISKYKTDVLFIENEENSQLFYKGSAADYIRQLTVGCEVAHSAGIKCANGGLVSELVILLTTDDLIKKGQNQAANEFIKNTIGDKLQSKFGISEINAAKLLALPLVVNQLTRGKELLNGYRGAGADYVNFHWYVADTDALETAKNFLEEKTGLPAITNEVGQQGNTDPAQVTSVMQKIVDLKLPMAIWFSMDISGYGQAKSLVNSDGTLRPNGQAFKAFIQNNF